MKSAYELAMERLQQESQQGNLSEDQKARAADIDARAKADIAQAEIIAQPRIAEATATGDLGRGMELEQDLKRDILRINERAEAEKEKLWEEPPAEDAGGDSPDAS